MARPVTTASGPGAYAPGWYAFKATNGTVGVVYHHGNGTISLGKGLKLATAIDLHSRGTSADLASINWGQAFQQLGATAKQMTEMIVQIDAGTGNPSGGNASQINIPLNAKPTASRGTNQLNTSPHGDAQGSNLLNLNLPSGLSGLYKSIEGVLGWITTQSNWVRVLEVVGGGVLILFAFKELAK